MSVGNISFNSPSATSLQVQQPKVQQGSDADGDSDGSKAVTPAAPPPLPPATRGRSVDVSA
jgi:hypothetical protein